MGRVKLGGLVIAGVGFFLTRFTVTLAYQGPVRFYLAGVLPLALGLSLAAFGVGLSVADVDPALVRTTALWCVVGAATMLVLVVLTLLGSTPGQMTDFATLRSRTYLSNFLIGGSIGGTLTGLYAARNRRQRGQLQQYAHRLAVLNRLLRHEVLNSVSVIRGYATADDDDLTDSTRVIQEHSSVIEETIEDVKHLTRRVGDGATTGDEVPLVAALDESVAALRGDHPDAEVTVTAPDAVDVYADERLGQVFDQLLENAVVHAETTTPAVAVTVTATPTRVEVTVADEGPGLPDRQRRLLEEGAITEFDDPSAGFGLNVVRLLVESYGGRVVTDAAPDGTAVTVELRRANDGDGPLQSTAEGVTGVRPSVPHLAVVFGAALVAGVPYGVIAELFGGSVAFIGVYYGVSDPVVGWLTHEFHSVVFGFVYAGLLSLVPADRRTDLLTYLGVGAGWSLALWLGAAGFVSPVWLRLLGIEVTVPDIQGFLLWTHLVWGLTLSLLTWAGYRLAVPWLQSRSGDPPAA